MQSKKSKKADLESKRSVFFLIGLSVAILSTVFIIQIETEVQTPPITTPKEVFADLFTVPQTKYVEEVAQQQEQAKKQAEPVDPDKWFQIDDDPVAPSTKLSTQSSVADDRKIEEVGFDKFEDDIPTLPIVSVQQIAVPLECEGVEGSTERLQCLNDWIQQYIRKHSTYPKLSIEWGEEDKVYVSFVIDENGQVGDVTLIRGDYQNLNQEAIRVLKGMPKFSPAKHQGRKAKMQMSVPVNFKLN